MPNPTGDERVAILLAANSAVTRALPKAAANSKRQDRVQRVRADGRSPIPATTLSHPCSCSNRRAAGGGGHPSCATAWAAVPIGPSRRRHAATLRTFCSFRCSANSTKKLRGNRIFFDWFFRDALRLPSHLLKELGFKTAGTDVVQFILPI